MHLVYENTKEEIIAIKKTPVHRPPHLHNALEIVYVTEGCVELGVGEELFHMDQGDIGFIFPNIIHHYQVFSYQRNQAIYLNASPFLVDRFTDILENKAPKLPVIKASSIESDVYRAFYCTVFDGVWDTCHIKCVLFFRGQCLHTATSHLAGEGDRSKIYGSTRQ